MLAVERRPSNIANLVTTAWGWSLAALFLFVVLAFGVYWHHPLYQSPGPKLSPLLEFAPLLIAGIFWLVSVVAIVLKAVSYAQRNHLTEGDLSQVAVAHGFIFILATVNTFGFGNAIGVGIATFLNGCLLVLCLIYLAVGKGVGARIGWSPWLYTAGVIADIAACWF